jgi:AAA domain, putative AbiEii toxin, Type IV TA system/AAA ATPase domain
MRIDGLRVENFKGIRDEIHLDLAPITVFVGENSSGKSSCIHALAALSQTVNLQNTELPLVLDHEFAHVHLGRFIEIVHSNSYRDTIGLGVHLGGANYLEPIEKAEAVAYPRFKATRGSIQADFDYKCTQRTQVVEIENATYSIDGKEFRIRRSKDGYWTTRVETGERFPCRRDGSLYFELRGLTARSPSDYAKLVTLSSAQDSLRVALQGIRYLGPFRIPPLRQYQTRGSIPKEVGPLGESTVTLLANEAIQSRSRPHIAEIAEWLSLLGLAKSLDISRLAKTDAFGAALTLDDDEAFPIADLGYGLSQVLPVLTQCSFAPSNSTLLFEQPEIHLHPLAAANLGRIFGSTVSRTNGTILIETHSPELVSSLQTEIKEGRLSAEDVKLYRVNRQEGASKFQHIEIDTHAEIYENWRKGFSSEF